MSDQAAKIKDTLLKKHNERTKEASISRKLTDMAYKLGLKSPSLNKQLNYGFYRGTPGVAGLVGGTVGGVLLGNKLAPMLGIETILTKQTVPEFLVELGITGAGGYAGGNLGTKLLDPVGKRLARKYTPETAKYFNLANPYRIDMPKMELNLSKHANLSRAAKGAIAAPIAALALGPIAAATHMPGVVDDMIAHLGTKGGTLESIPSFLKPAYGPLRLPYSLGITKEVLPLEASQVAGASLAGLSALGAGAGKLSEKLIPIAKKSKAPMSLVDKFKASSPQQKALVAAALFPWTLAAGAGAYALSDSDI